MNTTRTTAPRRRRLAVATTALLAIALGAAPALAAGTLDQYQTSHESSSVVGDNDWRAQTFTAGLTGELVQVDLYLQATAITPGDLTVQIQTVDGAGQPSGTVLGSATVDPGATVGGTPFKWVAVPLTGVPSQAGTQYAIVLSSPTSANIAECGYVGGCWVWGRAANSYPHGKLLYSINGGASWFSASTLDHMFKTYVEESAVTIESLIAEVEALDLSKGLETSLVYKLDNAARNFDDDLTSEGCEKLASFADQVAAKSGKQIDPADADALIADANTLQDTYGCD